MFLLLDTAFTILSMHLKKYTVFKKEENILSNKDLKSDDLIRNDSHQQSY